MKIERLYTDICNVDDIPRQGSRRILTPAGEIAIFRTLDDEIYALKNQCPHKKGPLSEGIVHSHHVTCPLHNWVISLKTGEAQGSDKGCTPTLPVKIDDNGTVRVALDAGPQRAVA